MENNLIYDIGAHMGKDSEFYLKKGFEVVAVEANPYCCKEIKQRLNKYIESGQLILNEYAIAGYVGEVELSIHKKHTDWGAVDKKWNAKYSDEIEKITVPCQTLNLSPWAVPYYIKIDIEGSDAMCIKQLKGHRLPKYLSAELLTFNNIQGRNVNCMEVISALLEVGYTKFQLVDQSKNHLTKCPSPAKEGGYVDYKFDGYCSGLFGKELPEDKWSDIDEILLQYAHYFYQKPNCCGEDLNKDGWYDIHATN